VERRFRSGLEVRFVHGCEQRMGSIDEDDGTFSFEFA
jgi:hypothetical protein